MSPAATSTETNLLPAVTELLVQEAVTLDEGRYSDWLDLLSEDIRYRMPNVPHRTPNVEPPARQLAFYDDDKRALRIRVARAGMDTAWSEQPPSRTVHMISNVLIRGWSSETELNVRSSFLVYRHRLSSDVELFAGHREDTLRRVDGSWLICQRTIHLAANVLPAKNLSLFF